MRQCPTRHLVLVGISNPWSTDSKDILSPVKPNCTGSNLLKILQFVDPSYTAEKFYEDFPERVNLYDVGADYLSSRKIPSDIVAFGKMVGAALANIPGGRVKPLSSVKRGIHIIHFIPHPSGLNRWYNSDDNKRAAGSYLLNLVRSK